MDRKVVPFRRWHFTWLGDALEPGPFTANEATLAILEQHNSYAGIVDGEVVCCAGTIPQWPTRHVAWALLGPNAAQNMKWITKEVRRNLASVKGRIELTVRVDFPAGQKWAEMLGFRVESPRLERFGPYEEDHVGFVRIN